MTYQNEVVPQSLVLQEGEAAAFASIHRRTAARLLAHHRLNGEMTEGNAKR